MEGIALPLPRWWLLGQKLYALARQALRVLSPEKPDLAAGSSADQLAADTLDTYGNAILRCAYSYLHNMDDAEEILQDTLLKLLTAAPVFESETHKTAEGREDLSFVWDAVRQLPVQFREVIHLHYYEGYSTEEIANILKRKPATVRSDLRRGREKLKAILKEAYDFEV